MKSPSSRLPLQWQTFIRNLKPNPKHFSQCLPCAKSQLARSILGPQGARSDALAMGRKRGCCVLGVLQGKPGAGGLHGVKEEGRKSGLIGKLQGEQPGLVWLCQNLLWTCGEWRMKECVELREKHVSFP